MLSHSDRECHLATVISLMFLFDASIRTLSYGHKSGKSKRIASLFTGSMALLFLALLMLSPCKLIPGRALLVHARKESNELQIANYKTEEADKIMFMANVGAGGEDVVVTFEGNGILTPRLTQEVMFYGLFVVPAVVVSRQVGSKHVLQILIRIHTIGA